MEVPSYFDDKLQLIHKDIKKLYRILQDKPVPQVENLEMERIIGTQGPDIKITS